MTAGLLTVSAAASAVTFDPDLVITGSVELSTSIGPSPFSDGDVTQAGSIRIIQGGGTTSSAFSTSPGPQPPDNVNDGTTVLPPTNPLSGALTDTGDGVGFSTNLDTLGLAGFNFVGDGFNFVIDASLGLTNNSFVNTYDVTVRVDYSNVVDADGNDAFSEVEMDVELDTVNVLLSDVASDTFLGDSFGGTPTGTFGEVISDIGFFDFVVTLGPGASAQVTNVHQWEGSVFEVPGGAFADITNDITVLEFTCIGPMGGPCSGVADSDGDGVADVDDLCPDSDLSGATVVIAACDSGAANQVDVDGCTVNQQIAAIPAGSDRQFSRAVRRLLRRLFRSGVITRQDETDIRACI